MDQTALVDAQINDGRQLLDRLAQEGIPVTAACWLKESESGRWYLYLATPLVSEGGVVRPAYRRILPLVQQMPQPVWIDPFDVKVVEGSGPVARAAQEVLRRYPGGRVIRNGGFRFGDVIVEAAYIYPSVTNDAATAPAAGKGP